MDVIYADELTALNALIDGVLLALAARAAGLPPRRGRIALAGLLGGLYALWAAVGPAALRTAGAKGLFSLILCAAAFGAGRSVWKGWAAFLGLSAQFAGLVYAAALLSGQRASPGSVTAWVSARLLLVCLALCRGAVELFLSRPKGGFAAVELTLGERSVTLRALRDTGNRLRDPVSGCPVLVADGAAMRPLLGDALPLPVPEDAAALLRLLGRDGRLSSRLGLVSYASVGGAGLMVTVRPDRATINGESVRCLAAVSPAPIANGEYEAVF